jgi:hypothetical protein
VLVMSVVSGGGRDVACSHERGGDVGLASSTTWRLVRRGHGVVTWHATVVRAHAWPEWAIARGGRQWWVVVVVGRKEVMGSI